MLPTHFLNLPEPGVNLLNVLVASLVVSTIGLLTVICARNQRLSLRHSLLCMTLLATLASPLLCTLASSLGQGLFPVSKRSMRSPLSAEQQREPVSSRQPNRIAQALSNF